MKPEYEDVRKIADATGKSVREIHEIILKEQNEREDIGRRR